MMYEEYKRRIETEALDRWLIANPNPSSDIDKEIIMRILKRRLIAADLEVGGERVEVPFHLAIREPDKFFSS